MCKWGLCCPLALCSAEATMVSAPAQGRPAGPGLGGVRRAEEGCCQAGAGSPKPAAPVPGEQSGQSGAAAQIPDLLPPSLSVLGAAKNP